MYCCGSDPDHIYSCLACTECTHTQKEQEIYYYYYMLRVVKNYIVLISFNRNINHYTTMQITYYSIVLTSCMCVQTLLVALDDSVLLYATCVQGQQSNRSSQIHSQDFFLCKFEMEKEYKVVLILT